MIDRRFLDIKFTVKGFLSSFSGLSAEYGDQYILSADLDQTSYPGGKKDCIAINRDSWIFIKPNYKTATEVINLSTGEILKYTYHSGSYASSYSWDVIGYIGAYILPYVVDKAVTSHAAVQGKVGLTYILTDTDDYVYKVTGTGANDHTTIGSSLSVGEKVGVIESGKTFTVINEDGTIKFEDANTYDYIAANSLVLSKNTQNLYMSGSSTGYDLIPTNQQRTSAGEATGTLCLEKHVFTATELTDKYFYLSNPTPEGSENTLVCFLNGNVHMHDIDFSVYRDSSNNLLQIIWSSESYNWLNSSPRAGETAIFQYYKL